MLERAITFIGAGNMTGCILRGLLRQGYRPQQIVISNRGKEKLQRLVGKSGLVAADSNRAAVENAEVVVLAVKPNIVESVCKEIAPIVNRQKPLIVSLATATRVDAIQRWFGTGALPIVRTMTNTATAVGKGTTALFANRAVTAEQAKVAASLFQASGSTFWVDNEKEINRYSPLVGCGPAHLYLLLEAMEKAAVDRGIPPKHAQEISLETVIGAAELAKVSKRPVAELRQQVTTPGGATEYSLKPLLKGRFFDLFKESYRAAEARCEEIEEASTTTNLSSGIKGR